MTGQHLGTLIKKIRTAASYTLKMMSERLEIDITLLSRIEHHDRLPTVHQLEKICQLFPTHERELRTHWLSAKILSDISNYEDIALEAMQIAEDTLKYKQKDNSKLDC